MRPTESGPCHLIPLFTLPALLSIFYPHWPFCFLNMLLWFLPQDLCIGCSLCSMLFPWLCSSNDYHTALSWNASYSRNLSWTLWRDTTLTLSLFQHMLLYNHTLFISLKALSLPGIITLFFCLCSSTECKGHSRRDLIYLVHCYVPASRTVPGME